MPPDARREPRPAGIAGLALVAAAIFGAGLVAAPAPAPPPPHACPTPPAPLCGRCLHPFARHSSAGCLVQAADAHFCPCPVRRAEGP